MPWTCNSAAVARGKKMGTVKKMGTGCFFLRHERENGFRKRFQEPALFIACSLLSLVSNLQPSRSCRRRTVCRFFSSCYCCFLPLYLPSISANSARIPMRPTRRLILTEPAAPSNLTASIIRSAPTGARSAINPRRIHSPAMHHGFFLVCLVCLVHLVYLVRFSLFGWS